MGRYQMDTSEDGFMGEGTSCICRKGKHVETGAEVAIKVYKKPESEAALAKFRRSVHVLQRLQEPFERPTDPKLWNAQLETVKPAGLFMQLRDYSTDATGEAGRDQCDNQLYMVNELAQYSLQDYVSDKKRKSAPPSQETVRSLAKAIILVMAGLHAKGFVHLDIKPENLMIFDGCLKLIDVDGCVEIGQPISKADSSISFSACYCAPEFAKFVMQKDDASLYALPGLDTWSVGCTICELVTLDPILRSSYKSWVTQFGRRGRIRFMDSLASMSKAPLPSKVQQFDAEFVELMNECLLVCPESQRRTCAESLNASYLASDKLQRTKSSPLRAQAYEEAYVVD